MTFGKLAMNEQARMTCSSVTVTFKNALADDGSTIKGSDYAFLIKALDPSGVGLFDVKTLLSLLEKNCKSFSTDCTLELRYMATVIE
jgi:hypothetical protein